MKFSDHQGFLAKFKILGVAMKFSSTAVHRSIETLMEKINPVVSQNFEFEYRDVSKITALQSFRTIKIVTKSKNHGFFNEVLLYK